MVSVAFSLAQATAPVLTAVDATAPISVTIDTTAPTITSLNVPARAIPGFVVSWSAQDNLIGVSHYDVRYKSESSGWTDWVSTPVTQALFTEPGGHVYTFRVSATDGVGNESDWSESGQVTVPLVKKYYAAAGRRVAMRAEGVVYYLHGDHLGSTSLVTDGAGNVVAQQLYLPYGAPRWGSGTLPTDFTFTGQRADTTGLMYYRARYYSSSLGRFVSADTIVPSPGNPQSLNRYTYGLNNPVKYTDPTGHRVACGVNGVECESDSPSIPSQPAGRYLRTKQGYWFDNSHFGTGNPAKIINDVRAGGWIRIPGGVQMGFRFEATYWVAPGLSEDQVYRVAYGIHENWSRRFETWEGDFPLQLGAGTSFAMEDLPSHHIGFMAAKKGITPWEVIVKYLGGAEGTNQEPPRNVKNHQFTPLVQLADGRWVNVPWPKVLSITPIGSESGLWRFGSEQSYGPGILNPFFREWMREQEH